MMRVEYLVPKVSSRRTLGRWGLLPVGAVTGWLVSCGPAPSGNDYGSAGATTPTSQAITAAPNLLADIDCATNPQACCPTGSTIRTLTNNNDATVSTTRNVCILALNGNDVVTSTTDATARVFGGEGRDSIVVNAQGGAVVYGGPGDDSIVSGKGGLVVPGPGKDAVTSRGAGNTVAIFDLCEIAAGEALASDGAGTLISPVPLPQLAAAGAAVTGFSNVVVEPHSCLSSCVTKPDCNGHGVCAEGANAGQVKCKCDPFFTGPDCTLPDFDNDGYADSADLCPNIPTSTQVDIDGDGVGDECDNCPARANTAQGDGDQDGAGDVCDNCIAVPNGSQVDLDNNGIGDACDGSILHLTTNSPASHTTKIIFGIGTHAFGYNSGNLSPLIARREGTQGGTASFTPKGAAGQDVTIFDSLYGFGPDDQGGGNTVGDLIGGHFACQKVRFVTLASDLNQPVAASFPQDILHTVRYAHGTCAKRIPLRPLFEQMSSTLNTRITSEVLHQTEDVPLVVTIERQLDVFQPYFRSELTDVQMGIFFAAEFRLKIGDFPDGTIKMSPAFSFTPKADDGFVQVNPVAQGIVALVNPNVVTTQNGQTKHVETFVKEGAQLALKTAVPDAIEAQAAAALSRPLSTLAVPIKLNQSACSHTAPLDAQQNLCLAQVQLALGTIDAGAAGADIQRLLAMLTPAAFTCSDDDRCLYHPMIPTCDHAAPLAEQQNACFEPLMTQLRLGTLAGDDFASKAAAAIEPRNLGCNGSNQCIFHPIVQQINVLPHDIELVFSPNPAAMGPDHLTAFYEAIRAMPGGTGICDPLPPSGVNCGRVELFGHPDGFINSCPSLGDLSCTGIPAPDLTPTLTVNVRVEPTFATGTFNVLIDDVVRAAALGKGGTTGAVMLSPGIHTVRETAAGATLLEDYGVSFSGDCPGGVVTLALGDKKTCTITNTNFCHAECEADRDACMADVPQPGGPTAAQCAQLFNQCRARCP